MVDIREQSPLSLAFVGDAVYSLLIRQHFVTSKRYNINVLNKMTVKYVSAHGQFMALELIRELLTDEESAVAKRGQRLKSQCGKKCFCSRIPCINWL